jgi:hypothetical protein
MKGRNPWRRRHPFLSASPSGVSAWCEGCELRYVRCSSSVHSDNTSRVLPHRVCGKTRTRAVISAGADRPRATARSPRGVRRTAKFGPGANVAIGWRRHDSRHASYKYHSPASAGRRPAAAQLGFRPGGGASFPACPRADAGTAGGRVGRPGRQARLDNPPAPRAAHRVPWGRPRAGHVGVRGRGIARPPATGRPRCSSALRCTHGT